jgi:hypothetical protein
MSHPQEISRDLRLDLFRGLALWLIFLAHIPGNIISKFIPYHYGFSDAAEMFIFVSGYASAYVYGQMMQQHEFVASAAYILNRAFHLYVAQIFLFVVFVGEIAFFSHGTDTFDDAMNVRIFHEQPDAATLAVLRLKFMPVNMDVLPVYIVLLVGFPPMLWLLRRMPVLAFAASALLYLLADVINLNLSAFPRGSWYFNPLAWQFLFVLGAWCGLGGANWLWSFIRSPAVLGIAAAYVVFGLLVVAAWHTPTLSPYVPDWLEHPLGKTNLGFMRLAHFLAIGIICCALRPSELAAVDVEDPTPGDQLRAALVGGLLLRGHPGICRICNRRRRPEQHNRADSGARLRYRRYDHAKRAGVLVRDGQDLVRTIATPGLAAHPAGGTAFKNIGIGSRSWTAERGPGCLIGPSQVEESKEICHAKARYGAHNVCIYSGMRWHGYERPAESR